MKITELNKPKQIDEMSSLAGALFGEVPMAALKGLFTGKGGKHQLAQDIFLRDFYQDALTSLDNGIKSGYVDPNKEYVPQSNAASEKDPQADDTNTKTPAPAPTTAPTTPTTAPAPTAISPKPKPSGPTGAEQTVAAAQKHRQDVASASNRMAVGKAAQAKPAFQRTADDKLAMKAAGLSEARFARLNYIFESLISEMNGEGETTTSITDHMIEWFGLYMTGVNWESKKAAIIPRIKQIQDTYSSDKGKVAIKNLGRLAYAISGKSGQLPKGAENAAQNAVGAQSASKQKSPEQLAADLAAQPPRVQDKIIKQVKDARYK
jgi:hypothetical protein